jgi:hypothetical protein
VIDLDRREEARTSEKKQEQARRGERGEKKLEFGPGRDFGIGIREFPDGKPSRSRRFSSREYRDGRTLIKWY